MRSVLQSQMKLLALWSNCSPTCSMSIHFQFTLLLLYSRKRGFDSPRRLTSDEFQSLASFRNQSDPLASSRHQTGLTPIDNPIKASTSVSEAYKPPKPPQIQLSIVHATPPANATPFHLFRLRCVFNCVGGNIGWNVPSLCTGTTNPSEFE